MLSMSISKSWGNTQIRKTTSLAIEPEESGEIQALIGFPYDQCQVPYSVFSGCTSLTMKTNKESAQLYNLNTQPGHIASLEKSSAYLEVSANINS